VESNLNTSVPSPINKFNSSISVKRRSCKVLPEINSPVKTIVEIVAQSHVEKVLDDDSGPMLPETQALKVEDEKESDDDLESFEVAGDIEKTSRAVKEEVISNELSADAENQPEPFKDKSLVDKPKSTGRKSRRFVLNSCFKGSDSDEKKVTSDSGTCSTINGDMAAETPLTSNLRKLKRSRKLESKLSINAPSIKNDSTSLELRVDDTETQPFVPQSSANENLCIEIAGEQETQPLPKDPEVLLPGEVGNEIDMYAETQPLHESDSEEPTMKKDKLVDTNIVTEKMNKRSRSKKQPLSGTAQTDSRRKSGRKGDNQIEEPSPKIKLTRNNRGRKAKEIPQEVSHKVVIKVDKKKALSKDNRRSKVLRIPSSLLIQSPATEDMFVDDADLIPSPVVSNVQEVSLENRPIRTRASKAVKNKVEVPSSSNNRKGNRLTRGATTSGTSNIQSIKLTPINEIIKSNTRRKSIDDFSPRSIDKMEEPKKLSRGESKTVKDTKRLIHMPLPKSNEETTDNVTDADNEVNEIVEPGQAVEKDINQKGKTLRKKIDHSQLVIGDETVDRSSINKSNRRGRSARFKPNMGDILTETFGQKGQSKCIDANNVKEKCQERINKEESEYSNHSVELKKVSKQDSEGIRSRTGDRKRRTDRNMVEEGDNCQEERSKKEPESSEVFKKKKESDLSGKKLHTGASQIDGDVSNSRSRGRKRPAEEILTPGSSRKKKG